MCIKMFAFIICHILPNTVQMYLYGILCDLILTKLNISRNTGLCNWLLNFKQFKIIFLNQAHTGQLLAYAWFLKFPFVCDVGVCMCVCVHPRLVVWYESPYDWLNKFYSLYMATIVGIIGRRGLTTEVHHRKQSNKSKLVLY